MKIKSIQIPFGTRYIIASYSDVGSIEDNSVEWENHIDFFYRIKDKEGNLIAEIVNCGVEITYFKEEDNA